MDFIIKQISHMEKIRATDTLPQKELLKRTALKGERVSYQICLKSTPDAYAEFKIESNLKEHVEVFVEKEVYMDCPVYNTEGAVTGPGEEFITLEPGFMPDVLIPLKEQNNIVRISPQNTVLWVNVDIPKDIDAKVYEINISATLRNKMCIDYEILSIKTTKMEIEVIDKVLPEQKIIYTRWFHADCIAVQHNVEIYSDAHWALIEDYIRHAANVGMNMILVPIHTPPLDTEIGTARPCVQLIDIEKNGNTYTFNFSKFERFINICKKCGIKYFEMAHLFTQWGAKSAPNILVAENGKTDYKFGWHVAANEPMYIEFLKQYITAISDELKKENIDKNTYFHVSDEPNTQTIENYETALNILKPLIGNSKLFDALSHVEFYEKGLVTCPVTSVGTIHEFLPHKIENQWAYYCCDPIVGYTNSFLSVPSARVRILGVQLYKYDVKGFLHWGLNFYNSYHSAYTTNPYLTTSSDRRYSSGDAYILYPSRTGAYNSIRGEMTYQALQDTRLLDALAQKIGKEKVIETIDELAERNLRFDDYPISNEFYDNLHNKICEMLK